MRFVKKFFGILLCVCAFGFTVATEQVERNMQPFFIGLVCVCIVGAVLLLKSSKKSKSKAPETHTTMAEGDLVTVQTDYTPSTVPDDIVKEMRKYYTLMQAQRDAEIMADSYRLASTTLNLETFCSRYDLAMQKAHTLLQAEQVGVRGIQKLNCHNACQQVINSASALKIRALHDFETEEIYKADALKTNKGKLNRYVKILMELEKAEPTFMFMEEYDALVEKIKDRISQFESAEKATQK
ncbi:MAG: hypothetical protein PUB42_01735 [Firmicutes bacterium]|nr:hypothetical protein [Bacillota bacterium]